MFSVCKHMCIGKTTKMMYCIIFFVLDFFLLNLNVYTIELSLLELIIVVCLPALLARLAFVCLPGSTI